MPPMDIAKLQEGHAGTLGDTLGIRSVEAAKDRVFVAMHVGWGVGFWSGVRRVTWGLLGGHDAGASPIDRPSAR